MWSIPKFLCLLAMACFGIGFANPNMPQIMNSYIAGTQSGAEDTPTPFPGIRYLQWKRADPRLGCESVGFMQAKDQADAWMLMLFNCGNPLNAYAGGSLRLLGRWNGKSDVYVVQNGPFRNAIVIVAIGPSIDSWTKNTRIITTYTFQERTEPGLARWIVEKNSR